MNFANGLTSYNTSAPGASLGPGPASLLGPNGTALVIYSGEDDQLTEPDGRAGSRIACGVILAAAAPGAIAKPVAVRTSAAPRIASPVALQPTPAQPAAVQPTPAQPVAVQPPAAQRQPSSRYSHRRHPGSPGRAGAVRHRFSPPGQAGREPGTRAAGAAKPVASPVPAAPAPASPIVIVAAPTPPPLAVATGPATDGRSLGSGPALLIAVLGVGLFGRRLPAAPTQPAALNRR